MRCKADWSTRPVSNCAVPIANKLITRICCLPDQYRKHDNVLNELAHFALILALGVAVIQMVFLMIGAAIGRRRG